MRLFLEASATRELERLPGQIEERVRHSLLRLIGNPLLGKQLHAEYRTLRSLRVGDYRVLYQFFPQEQKIVVVHVAHRSAVYR